MAAALQSATGSSSDDNTFESLAPDGEGDRDREVAGRAREIDPLVAQVLDSRSSSNNHHRRTSSASASASSTTSSQLDALFSSSTDPHLATLRAQRLQQLHDEQARLAAFSSANPSHQNLTMLSDQEEAIRATAAAPSSLLFFTHEDFTACQKMRRALDRLSPLHPEARCYGVKAEECAWLAGKLAVRVLPVVVGFLKGVEVGRLVGFDGLFLSGEAEATGKGDVTRAVESRLVQWGVFERVRVGEDVDEHDEEEERGDASGKGKGKSNAKSKGGGGIQDRKAAIWQKGAASDDDDDDDWD